MKKLLLFMVSLVLSFVIVESGISKNGFGMNKADNTSDSIPARRARVYIPADSFPTNSGLLKVTVVGHGSLMFEYGGKVIHVDPYSKIANYARLPKADLIILTHDHSDHLDKEAIDVVKKSDTQFIVTQACNGVLGYGDIIKNKEKTTFGNVEIEAVAAYNKVHRNSEEKFYHPKGVGNGYIFTFDNLKVYVAGDTENINEMKKLQGTIDIAFMPKNIPYTMTDDMFLDAAKKVMPKYLYPYHYTTFNKEQFEKELEGTDIKLEVRSMSNK